MFDLNSPTKEPGGLSSGGDTVPPLHRRSLKYSTLKPTPQGNHFTENKENKDKHSKTKQNKAKQCKTMQNKAKQRKTKKNKKEKKKQKNNENKEKQRKTKKKQRKQRQTRTNKDKQRRQQRKKKTKEKKGHQGGPSMHIHFEAPLTDAPVHGTRVLKDAISKPLALDLETKRMLALQMVTEQHVVNEKITGAPTTPCCAVLCCAGRCRVLHCAVLPCVVRSFKQTICVCNGELRTTTLRVAVTGGSMHQASFRLSVFSPLFHSLLLSFTLSHFLFLCA